ncbi:MAG: response regulator [Desulfobacterales bacterium]
MAPYRIVLADDHAILREGIRKMIDDAPGMKVVGEACDGIELLEVLRSIPADMVVLDVSMPRMGGIEAAGEIQKFNPRLDILFLSMHGQQKYLFLAVKAGAKGYLLKENSGTELIEAIRSIRNGGTYLSPLLLREMPEDLIGIFRNNVKFDDEPLSLRERQVIKLVAEGRTSNEIADLLGISAHTVNNHRKNIKRKLGIRKNAELVKYAIRKGYDSTPLD